MGAAAAGGVFANGAPMDPVQQAVDQVLKSDQVQASAGGISTEDVSTPSAYQPRHMFTACLVLGLTEHCALRRL